MSKLAESDSALADAPPDESRAQRAARQAGQPSERLATLCITGLGAGYAPVTPATFGSALAAAIYAVPAVALWQIPQATWLVDVGVLLPGILLATLASLWWGDWALQHFRSTDPRPFVLDEFAGQWIALLGLPVAAAGGGAVGVLAVIAGQFVLFRVCDILKPPPAAQLERLPGAWGVLCDDLAAGFYANLLGQVLWRFTPLAGALGLAPAGV